jgi:hypothetical protein
LHGAGLSVTLPPGKFEESTSESCITWKSETVKRKFDNMISATPKHSNVWDTSTIFAYWKKFIT